MALDPKEVRRALLQAQYASHNDQAEYDRLVKEYHRLNRLTVILSWSLQALNLITWALAIVSTFGFAGLIAQSLSGLSILATVIFGGLMPVGTMLTRLGYQSSSKFTADSTQAKYIEPNSLPKSKPNAYIRGFVGFVTSAGPTFFLVLTLMTTFSLVASNPISIGLVVGMTLALAAVLAVGILRSYYMGKQMQVGYQLNKILSSKAISDAELEASFTEAPLPDLSGSPEFRSTGPLSNIRAVFTQGAQQLRSQLRFCKP